MTRGNFEGTKIEKSKAFAKLGQELTPEVKAQPVWNASGTEDIALQNIQASQTRASSKVKFLREARSRGLAARGDGIDPRVALQEPCINELQRMVNQVCSRPRPCGSKVARPWMLRECRLWTQCKPPMPSQSACTSCLTDSKRSTPPVGEEAPHTERVILTLVQVGLVSSSYGDPGGLCARLPQRYAGRRPGASGGGRPDLHHDRATATSLGGLEALAGVFRSRNKDPSTMGVRWISLVRQRLCQIESSQQASSVVVMIVGGGNRGEPLFRNRWLLD